MSISFSVPTFFPLHRQQRTGAFGVLPGRQMVQYDDESDALFSTAEALAIASLDFLSVLMSVSQLQGALKLSVHHLTNALFHYLLISDEEIDGWKNNAHHFSSQLGSL